MDEGRSLSMADAPWRAWLAGSITETAAEIRSPTFLALYPDLFSATNRHLDPLIVPVWPFPATISTPPTELRSA